MSEMTDIEKQRGREYSKEELFEALSAAKKDWESCADELLEARKESEALHKDIDVLNQNLMSAESSLAKWKERANGFEERVDFLNSRNSDAQKGVDEANAERDRYRKALEEIRKAATGLNLERHKSGGRGLTCNFCGYDEPCPEMILQAALSAKGE